MKNLLMGMGAFLLFGTAHAALFDRGGGVGIGTRAMGMAGAFSAVADDLSTIYWNPAGLVKVQQPLSTLMYGSLFNDKSRNLFWAFHYPTRKDIHLSLGSSHMFFSDTGGVREDMYMSSVAVPLLENKNLLGGVNFRLLYADLQTDGIARGRGVDVGVLFQHPFSEDKRLQGALVLTDLATTLRFPNGLEQTVPRIVTLGGALFFQRHTLLALDVNWTDSTVVPKDQKWRVRGGLEHWFLGEKFALRTGFEGFQTLSGSFSAGTGYRTKRFQMDYAYLSHSQNLGNSHRISLDWKFNPSEFIENADARPYDLQVLVDQRQIHLQWKVSPKADVQGFYVWLKEEGEKDYRKVRPEPFPITECLLKGAEDGKRYQLYVQSILAEGEGPRSYSVTAEPRPMQNEARHFFDQAMKLYNEKQYSRSLYMARRAEELEPVNYAVKELLRKLQAAYKSGWVDQPR